VAGPRATGEDGGALAAGRGGREGRGKAGAVEEVVPERQGDVIVADESPADEERLRERVGPGLHVVADAEPELAAVAEETLKRSLVLRRRNDEDVPDAGEHQRRQRVVDHRLVVDGNELLAHRE